VTLRVWLSSLLGDALLDKPLTSVTRCPGSVGPLSVSCHVVQAATKKLPISLGDQDEGSGRGGQVSRAERARA
jgi:hypothetical protein